jgi:hypothetical protein
MTAKTTKTTVAKKTTVVKTKKTPAYVLKTLKAQKRTKGKAAQSANAKKNRWRPKKLVRPPSTTDEGCKRMGESGGLNEAAGGCGGSQAASRGAAGRARSREDAAGRRGSFEAARRRAAVRARSFLFMDFRFPGSV